MASNATGVAASQYDVPPHGCTRAAGFRDRSTDMAQVPAFHETIDSRNDNEGQKGGRNRSANHRHYARRRGMMDEVTSKFSARDGGCVYLVAAGLAD